MQDYQEQQIDWWKELQLRIRPLLKKYGLNPHQLAQQTRTAAFALLGLFILWKAYEAFFINNKSRKQAQYDQMKLQAKKRVQKLTEQNKAKNAKKTVAPADDKGAQMKEPASEKPKDNSVKKIMEEIRQKRMNRMQSKAE